MPLDALDSASGEENDSSSEFGPDADLDSEVDADVGELSDLDDKDLDGDLVFAASR